MKKLLFLLALIISLGVKAQTYPPKPDILNYINQVIKNNPDVLIRGNVMNRILKEVLNYPVDTIWIASDTLKYRQNGTIYNRLIAGGSGSVGGTTLAIRNTGSGVSLASLVPTADTLSIKRFSVDSTLAISVLLDSSIRLSAVSRQPLIQFADESVNLGTIGTVNKLNFTGAGVTASRSGNTIDVVIAGGGGGGGGGSDGNNYPTSVNLGGGLLTITRDSLAPITTSATTTDILEGTNLYFTNARARNAISATGPATFNTGTGVIGVDTAILATKFYSDQKNATSLVFDSATRILRLNLTDGNSLADTLQGIGDNWGSQAVVRDITLLGNGTVASPLKADTSRLATTFRLNLKVDSVATIRDTIMFFRVPGVDSIYFQINDQTALSVLDSTGSAIEIRDEAVSQGMAQKFNFVGTGVVTSVTDGVATVEINTGGGGGGGSDGNNYPVSLSVVNGVARIGRFGLPDLTYSFSTADIPEGVNQYFTTARVRSSLSASGPITYNSTTGTFGLDTAGLQGAVAYDTKISSLTSATQSNTINNVNYTQTWQWSGLTSNQGLQLQTFSNAQTTSSLLEVLLVGTTVNPGAVSSGIKILNSNASSAINARHTGLYSFSYGVNTLSGGTNIGIYTEATTSLTNIGIEARGAGYGAGMTNYGIKAIADRNSGTANIARNYALYGTTILQDTLSWALYTDSGKVRIGQLAGSNSRFVKVNADGEFYSSDTAVGGISSVRLNELLAANNYNTLANGNFTQQWDWTGLETDEKGLILTSTGSYGPKNMTALLVSANTDGNTWGNVIGIHGQANDASNFGGTGEQIGVFGEAVGDAYNSTQTTYGVKGLGTVGVWGQGYSSFTLGPNVIGVLGTGSRGVVGISRESGGTGVTASFIDTVLFNGANGSALEATAFGSYAGGSPNTLTAGYFTAFGAINNYAIRTDSGLVRLGTLKGIGNRMVIADANGIISTQAIPGGGGAVESTTASNGLTLLGYDVKLGGTLSEATNINSGAWGISIAGSSNTLFSLLTSGTLGAQIISTSVGGIGAAISSTGTPVWAVNTSPSAGIQRAFVGFRSGITGTIGAGLSSQYDALNTADASVSMGAFQYAWTSATAGAETAEYQLKLRNAGSEITRLAINGAGEITASGYGSGAVTGTITRWMGVTATGKFVEFAPPTLGEVNTMSNIGTGASLFSSKVGVDFQIKSIVAGANISFVENANDITISAAGGGAGADGNNFVTSLGLSSGTLTLGRNGLSDLTTSISTSNVTEIGNLYYTDARARAALGAGTGMSYNAGTGVFTNTAPDQTVVITAGTNVSVTGTYPNFTVNATGGGTVSSVGLSSSTTGVSITGSPVTGTGTLNFEIAASGTGSTGLLSSTDWNTFNNKVSTSRAINTQHSIVGGGDLSADRTFNLLNDVASPGPLFYYGTNVGSTKGWHALPAAGNSVYTEKLNLGTATFWNAAQDNGSGVSIREALKVGDGSDPYKRMITINAVFYVSQAQFGGTGSWVQCGLITDGTYRPTNSIYFRGSTLVNATSYKNPGGTQFVGNASYTDVNIRIDPNGQIFVYINGINTYATLSGSNMVIVPINITYFLSPSS